MNEARKQKQREYARQYYEEHKEELRKKKNEYRKNNLDKYRKNQKKYYQNNKDYYNNYSKEWSKQKLDNLLKQLEAYENMRKEVIEFVESMEYCGQEDYFYDNKTKDPCGNDNTFNDSKNKLLNILNKVGEDNE